MNWPSKMHRQPEHVMMFLLAEMGTNGSLDKWHQLMIKGSFALKFFELIQRRYISNLISSVVLAFF
jgi:translation initiation factor 2 subunit 2